MSGHDVDPRLASALTVQLEAWRAALAGGAERTGWKLGMGERERIGRGPVVGHLTSATRLEPGATYRSARAAALHADAEVALVLGRDVEPDGDPAGAIAGFGAALELVDLAGTDDPERIVAANVFHRAVAFGPLDAPPPTAPVTARLIVNGEQRAENATNRDYPELVRRVAALLGAAGERLRAGDRLITGAIVQLPVAPGDEVVADLGPLGSVHATIA